MKKILSLIMVVIILSTMALTAFAEVEYKTHEINITVNGLSTQFSAMMFRAKAIPSWEPSLKNSPEMNQVAYIPHTYSKQMMNT